MKQKVSYFRFAAIACSLLFGAATSEALEPALSDVVANVTKAMVPESAYQVIVTQSVEPPAPKDVSVMTTAPVEVGQFVLRFDMINGVSTTSTLLPPAVPADTSQVLMDAQSPQPTVIGQVSPVRLRFDIRKILAQVLGMNNIRIESEPYNGRAAWKVAAQTDDGRQGLAYVLYVDAGQWTVSKMSVAVGMFDFTDSQLSYVLVGAKFMPLMIVTTFAADGTRVVQEYGTYLFDE